MQARSASLYDIPRLKVWEEFMPYLRGDMSAYFCVVSSKALSSEALEALSNSANRLGYGISIVYITLNAEEKPALTDKDLLKIIEAMDPLCVVSCDIESATALANAYRKAIPYDCAASLLGRPIRAFSNFERMLQRNETKQKAWTLLKTLPSLN